jgi:hypothetical protein
MERKSNKSTQIWTPSQMCPCCGRIIMLLRHKTWTETNRRWVACYPKGWDGNPWFVPGGINGMNAKTHPRKYWAKWMYEKSHEEKEPEDPFFSLD